ncbi:hypothetical protein C3F09_05670 [candidate division GN15 bacterium]|uniref:Uncharacterized protein n=1 Tax=candidate division GN15 bacterium TaxID=2072418 RepID=A0A855X1I5_9BACT|nr:MAG: hypothetical protein C3F09_05670 [candidate division GN15 bacterium]
MQINSILEFLKEALTAIPAMLSGALAALSPLKQMILDQFGWPGLMAAYIAGGVILLLVVWRLTKLTFAAIKYLVVPSLGLALIVSLVSPYSFAAALPVTVTLCSLLLLAKG